MCTFFIRDIPPERVLIGDKGLYAGCFLLQSQEIGRLEKHLASGQISRDLVPKHGHGSGNNFTCIGNTEARKIAIFFPDAFEDIGKISVTRCSPIL